MKNFKFLIVLTILLAGCLCVSSTFAADISVNDIDNVSSVDNTQNIEIAHDDSSQKDVEINNLQGSSSDLQTKINNAPAGSTITLTENYTLTSQVNINKSLTIDGNLLLMDLTLLEYSIFFIVM